MSVKININFEEKKWKKIDLQKISIKAFKSTFTTLSYSKFFDYLEVSILACNDKKIKEYNKKFREKNKATNVISWPRIKKINYMDILAKRDISHLISIQENTLDIPDSHWISLFIMITLWTFGSMIISNISNMKSKIKEKVFRLL